MTMDTLVKYLIWIVLFAVLLMGIYFMLKRFGAL
jgi:hypothetical protein